MTPTPGDIIFLANNQYIVTVVLSMPDENNNCIQIVIGDTKNPSNIGKDYKEAYPKEVFTVIGTDAAHNRSNHIRRLKKASSRRSQCRQLNKALLTTHRKYEDLLKRCCEYKAELIALKVTNARLLANSKSDK